MSMYLLSLLVASIVVRCRLLWGLSCSSFVPNSRHIQRPLVCPVDNRLLKLRGEGASSARTSPASLIPSFRARYRSMGMSVVSAAAGRLDDSVSVLDGAKFAFMNSHIPEQQTNIFNIRMKGNISDPIDSDSNNNSAKSSNNRHLEAAYSANVANCTDDGRDTVQLQQNAGSLAILRYGYGISFENHDDILGYLGDSAGVLPPQTQDLLRRVTSNYVFGTNDDIITLQEIASIIEEEHRSRDVPVQVLGGSTGSSASNLVVFEADVTKTGEAFDELCSEILSLGALYQLPKEIILELLSAPIHATSSRTSTSSVLEYSNSISSSSAIIKCRAAFAAVGWKGVVFPKGLAIRPKTKFRSTRSFAFVRDIFADRNSDRAQHQVNVTATTMRRKKSIPLSWWHRTKTLQDIATKAVRNAAEVRPPPRRLIDRRQYLNSLDVQLRQLSTTAAPKIIEDSLVVQPTDVSALNRAARQSSVSPLVSPGVSVTSSSLSTKTGQFFFPETEQQWWQAMLSRRSVSNNIRAVRRFAFQQYSALKHQGRAGLVSYCFFNFMYYSVGVIWQWSRMRTLQSDPIPDFVSSLSRFEQPYIAISALLLRKFGKIFAYLYAFSQILKLPKLCTAVGLAPVASKCLEIVKTRFGVSETVATGMLVGLMVVVWILVISIPILSEYASLQHILYLEKQLIHVYGLHPV